MPKKSGTGKLGSLFSKISGGSPSGSESGGGGGGGGSRRTGGGGGEDGSSSGGGGAGTTTDAQAITDPRIPLTVRQKFSIGKSWKGITRALERTGVSMFVRMFQQTPEILSVFVRFSDLRTREEQATSEELQEHATLVMTTLDQAISCIEDGDQFVSFLRSTGSAHRKIPGFQSHFFWSIEKPFLDAVRETLEDRYTDNIENIYKITIKCILSLLVQGFEQQPPPQEKGHKS